MPFSRPGKFEANGILGQNHGGNGIWGKISLGEIAFGAKILESLESTHKGLN